MQGYSGSVYIDAFASGVSNIFFTLIDSTNFPLINNVVVSSGNWTVLHLTGFFLENILSFRV
jgi:hypothetical protein